jgi:hypothetical protein
MAASKRKYVGERMIDMFVPCSMPLTTEALAKEGRISQKLNLG